MAITLTEPVNYIVHQRDVSLETASVTIAGTYTTSLGTAEAKITAFSGGATIVDWTEIDASPSGNVFSGALTIPQGGWYLVQVRDGDNVGDTDVGSNKLGVGVIVATAGQSNMARFYPTVYGTASHDLLSLYNVSAWQHYPTGQGAGATTLGNKLATVLGIPIGLIDGSVGGTGLTTGGDSGSGYWLDTAGSSVYDDFQVKVNAAAPNGVEVIMWIQGENDSTRGVSYATHLAGMSTLMTNIRTDISNMNDTTNLPFIAAEIGSDATAGTTDAEANDIRNAIVDGVEANDDAYLGATTLDIARADDVHWTPTGQEIAAVRLALSYLKLLDAVTYSGLGPVINSYVTNSTTETDILIVDNGGTDFTPTSAITEFEVLDDGTPVTVSAAIRQNAHTIRLTHTAISGVKTIRYMYKAVPTITGVVIDDTTETLPLRSAGNGISERATSSGSGATNNRTLRNRIRRNR